MSIAERWNRYWFPEDGSLVRLGLFRIGVMALCLLDVIAYGTTALRNAAEVSAGTVQETWRPIYLFEVLGLGPLGLDAARIVYVAALAFCLLGLCGVAARFTCAVAALLVLYWTGLVYSFGKVHHEKVALAWAVIALPLGPVGARLSLDAVVRRLRGDPLRAPRHHAHAMLPLRVTMLTIAIGYGAAGWTKLVVAGPEWANGYTLMSIVMHYHNAWSEALGHDVALARAISVLTLAVQAGFPLVLLWPRTRWVFLPVAVGFHVSSWQSMDTGPYITLWFLLIAFLPLERIPSWWGARWRRGGAARVFATGVVVAPSALVLYVFSLYFPWWVFLALLPAVRALVLGARCEDRLRVVLPRDNRGALARYAALNWSGRLEVVAGEVDGLRVTDAEGHLHQDDDARRLVRARLALPLA